MKILIISHKFNPDIGGIETVSEILANEFILAGHQVRVITWSEDVTCIKFSFQIIRNPSFVKLFKQFIWANVVFENNPSTRLSWPALILNKPTVIALQTWVARTDGALTLIDKLKILKLKTAKKVISISKVIQEGTFKKSIIIPNPFNATLFTNVYKLAKEKDFVFLGRLVSDKGADMAIAALAELNENLENYNLSIIGDGPEKDNLKNSVITLGLCKNVSFHGNLTGENLVKELIKHRYMLIPSKWKEPFGVVALEGIACGCIPFVSDGGGLPDAVGNAGIVFKRGDLKDMVKKIKELLSDSKMENQLRIGAKKHLLAHDPKIIANRYLEVLKSVAI